MLFYVIRNSKEERAKSGGNTPAHTTTPPHHNNAIITGSRQHRQHTLLHYIAHTRISGVDVMSVQPSAAEPAVSNDDADCEVVNGGEDGGVQESANCEPAPIASAVQQAQAAFEVPDGFKRIMGEKRNPSNMYKLGVRVEETKTVPRHQPREGRWYCMANAACRQTANTFIRIKSNNTAAATTHLKALHRTTSKRGEAIVKR